MKNELFIKNKRRELQEKLSQDDIRPEHERLNKTPKMKSGSKWEPDEAGAVDREALDDFRKYAQAPPMVGYSSSWQEQDPNKKVFKPRRLQTAVMPTVSTGEDMPDPLTAPDISKFTVPPMEDSFDFQEMREFGSNIEEKIALSINEIMPGNYFVVLNGEIVFQHRSPKEVEEFVDNALQIENFDDILVLKKVKFKIGTCLND